jgi:hypothetical protein
VFKKFPNFFFFKECFLKIWGKNILKIYNLLTYRKKYSVAIFYFFLTQNFAQVLKVKFQFTYFCDVSQTSDHFNILVTC